MLFNCILGTSTSLCALVQLLFILPDDVNWLFTKLHFVLNKKVICAHGHHFLQSYLIVHKTQVKVPLCLIR